MSQNLQEQVLDILKSGQQPVRAEWIASRTFLSVRTVRYLLHTLKDVSVKRDYRSPYNIPTRRRPVWSAL